MGLICIFILAPEDCIGDVAGQLIRIGGTIEEMINDPSTSLMRVRAWIPANELVKFEVWLSKATQGAGQIRNPSSEKS